MLVGELRVDQAHHMTPRTEGARLILGPGFPGDLGDQMFGNEIANLPQNVKSGLRVGLIVFFFIPALWQG